MWGLRFAAAMFGYCVAVALSLSAGALLLAGWRPWVAGVWSWPSPEFFIELAGPTALAGALDAIAAGMLFLRQSRRGFPWGGRSREAFSAFLMAAGVWYGFLIALFAIAAVIQEPLHGDAYSYLWWGLGPICFTAGAACAEFLLRATVARREL